MSAEREVQPGTSSPGGLGDRVQILGEPGAPELPIVEGEGRAVAIVHPGTGARLRSLQRIELGPGARLVPLRHPSDAVYAIVAGAGRVHDDDEGTVQELETGSMFHVDAGTGYRAEAGDGGMVLVGGPAPVDPALYAEAS